MSAIQTCSKCGSEIYQGIFVRNVCAKCWSEAETPMPYHKCANDNCATTMSDGAPITCPEHQITMTTPTTPTAIARECACKCFDAAHGISDYTVREKLMAEHILAAITAALQQASGDRERLRGLLSEASWLITFPQSLHLRMMAELAQSPATTGVNNDTDRLDWLSRIISKGRGAIELGITEGGNIGVFFGPNEGAIGSHNTLRQAIDAARAKETKL